MKIKSRQNLDNMKNIHDDVIGHTFGGQSMECYLIIIGSVGASATNIKINGINPNEVFRQFTHDIIILNP